MKIWNTNICLTSPKSIMILIALLLSTLVIASVWPKEVIVEETEEEGDVINYRPIYSEKVKILRKEIDSKKLKTQIEIDGGINFQNAKMAKEAGAEILVSGTTIFKENGGNLKKNIQLLKTG